MNVFDLNKLVDFLALKQIDFVGKSKVVEKKPFRNFIQH